MASPDHLFALRTNFYLGAYQAAINNNDVQNLSEEDSIERDSRLQILHCSGELSACNQRNQFFTTYTSSGSQIAPLYLSGPQNKETTISSLREWLSDAAVGNNPVLRMVAGTSRITMRL